jgi:hypothetical protein
MSNDTIAIQLAVLAEQMRYIRQEMDDAKTARKGQYEKAEEHSRILIQMDGRMQKVEESLQQQAPTIEEFITIKHKVVGAGLFGRWTWWVFAGLVGLFCSFRVEIFKWLTRS